MLKKCSRCKEELSVEEFQKNRSAPDGLQYRCKACTKSASKICRARRGHLWLEKIDPWSHRPENRKQVNASTRKRRAKNPEKAREENRYWRERANPFSTAVIKAKLRAAKLGVVSTLTTEEWKSVVESRNFICHLCGEKIILEMNSPWRLSLDHVTPMSRRGGNVIENVLPAHRRCNQSRLDMTVEEFDFWLNKIYFRRSGHGESKESKFIPQPPPPLEKVDCIGL
jgi:hypothetical protein